MIRALQRIAFDWGVRCFGYDHMRDRRVRALRCAEEVIELAQVCGVSKEKLHLLIDTVYSKPEGALYQEMGGIAVTLAVQCEIMNTSIDQVLLAEISRCLAIDPKDFQKRNQAKIDLGLS